MNSTTGLEGPAGRVHQAGCGAPTDAGPAITGRDGQARRRRWAAAVVAAFVAAPLLVGHLLTGVASALPMCDVPVPPPVCDPGGGGDPPEPPPPPTGPSSAAFSYRLEQLSSDPYGAVRESDLDKVGVPSTSAVVLDGCASTAAGGALSYVWTFSDGESPLPSPNCQTAWYRPLSSSGASVGVTLTVTPRSGGPVSVWHRVRFRDIVIASLGDSAASGQGAPEEPGSSRAFTVSMDCARSGWAAKAQAALRLQRTLPDTTVHLWDITCSGASITSRGATDHVVSRGGLLDPFDGAHHSASVWLAPQVDRLFALQAMTKSQRLPAGLSIDRLLLTAGANDTGWGQAATDCMIAGAFGPVLPPAQPGCLLFMYQDQIRHAVAALPGHFDLLRAKFDELGVPRGSIYLSDYYDPLDSSIPQPVTCWGELLASQFLRQWAVTEVENPLQNTVAGKAQEFGWNLVSGNRTAFQGHGMCRDSGTRWVNNVDDSTNSEQEHGGTWHPNRAGQLAMADIAYRKITPGLAPQIAFQANTGSMWTVGAESSGDQRQGMRSGTSPAETVIPGGARQRAFQANTGSLWVAGARGTRDTALGMADGTSPSIAGLSDGGYVVAFQANTGSLWTYTCSPFGGCLGADHHLGMAAGTSPSIVGLPGRVYQIAFQANTGSLWVTGTTATTDLHLGLAPRTSPAVAAVASGGTQIVFRSNTGSLWAVGAGGTRDWGLDVRPGTSPAITAVTTGYEVAFQASSGSLWTVGTGGTGDSFLGMMPGSSPALA